MLEINKYKNSIQTLKNYYIQPEPITNKYITFRILDRKLSNLSVLDVYIKVTRSNIWVVAKHNGKIVFGKSAGAIGFKKKNRRYAAAYKTLGTYFAKKFKQLTRKHKYDIIKIILNGNKRAWSPITKPIKKHIFWLRKKHVKKIKNYIYKVKKTKRKFKLKRIKLVNKSNKKTKKLNIKRKVINLKVFRINKIRRHKKIYKFLSKINNIKHSNILLKKYLSNFKNLNKLYALKTPNINEITKYKNKNNLLYKQIRKKKVKKLINNKKQKQHRYGYKLIKRNLNIKKKKKYNLYKHTNKHKKKYTKLKKKTKKHIVRKLRKKIIYKLKKKLKFIYYKWKKIRKNKWKMPRLYFILQQNYKHGGCKGFKKKNIKYRARKTNKLMMQGW